MIETQDSRRGGQRGTRQRPPAGKPELIIGLSMIAAAALATFLALFITSRPFDPENSSVIPQQVVPAGPLMSPSPRPSPSISPTAQPSAQPTQAPAPAGETAPPADDATIQAHIERAIAADDALSQADVSTLVENGKVTIVGSVSSSELKARVGRLVRSVQGVTSIDNQVVVNQATP